MLAADELGKVLFLLRLVAVAHNLVDAQVGVCACGGVGGGGWAGAQVRGGRVQRGAQRNIMYAEHRQDKRGAREPHQSETPPAGWKTTQAEPERRAHSSTQARDRVPARPSHAP